MIFGSEEAGSILGRVTATRESGMVIHIESGMRRQQRKERSGDRWQHDHLC